MALRTEVLIDRLVNSLSEPAPIQPGYYSEREEFLRRKWDAVKPRGAELLPYDPNAKSSWQKEIDKSYGKKRPTPQNHRTEKGDEG